MMPGMYRDRRRVGKYPRSSYRDDNGIAIERAIERVVRFIP